MRNKQLKAVSLFSGAMGLDLGFEQAGVHICFASDDDPAAVATIRKNRPDLCVHDGDIRELSASDVQRLAGLTGDLDLVIGGPPCQSFSTAGKRLSLDDDRNGAIIFEFIRLLGELRPRFFVMENVKGILSASKKWRQLPYNNNGKRIDRHYGSLLEEVLSRIESLGYRVSYRILNAADYGVPQVRYRVFFVGARDETSTSLPEPTHSEQGDLLTNPWVPIKEVLGNLRNDDSHCNQFSERKLKYLKMIPPGGNWRALSTKLQKQSMGRAFYAKGGRTGYWRRLSFDKPAPTILTEPQNASTSLCHPECDRPLTVRECSRIQTFPDDWEFCGRGSAQYRLVGNAVPVLLAKAIAEHICGLMRDAPGQRRAKKRPRTGHQSVTC